MMQALEELKIISKEAKIPAQINHIKLAVADEWGLGKSICEWIADARKEKVDITADVYPYTYWYSTITVLTNDRNWDNREIWVRALADIGGPQNVIIARYSPDPSWEGKDLAQIAESSGKDAVAVIQQVIAKTHGPNSKESESIVCKAMKEDDLAGFIKDENIMFCSDGWQGGAHPRGAGSFPRMLGVYVRDKRLIPLEEAIRKATSLPAKRFGLLDRGTIKAGMKADIVVFDPYRIKDKATIEDSKVFSEGISDVLVNGVVVLENAGMTGARPGKGLKGHRQFLPISGLEANSQFGMKRSFRGPHLQVDLCP
jgi:N-acyl-D-amino-acid deacylase